MLYPFLLSMRSWNRGSKFLRRACSDVKSNGHGTSLHPSFLPFGSLPLSLQRIGQTRTVFCARRAAHIDQFI